MLPITKWIVEMYSFWGQSIWDEMSQRPWVNLTCNFDTIRGLTLTHSNATYIYLRYNVRNIDWTNTISRNQPIITNKFIINCDTLCVRSALRLCMKYGDTVNVCGPNKFVRSRVKGRPIFILINKINNEIYVHWIRQFHCGDGVYTIWWRMCWMEGLCSILFR